MSYIGQSQVVCTKGQEQITVFFNSDKKGIIEIFQSFSEEDVKLESIPPIETIDCPSFHTEGWVINAVTNYVKAKYTLEAEPGPGFEFHMSASKGVSPSNMHTGIITDSYICDGSTKEYNLSYEPDCSITSAAIDLQGTADGRRLAQLGRINRVQKMIRDRYLSMGVASPYPASGTKVAADIVQVADVTDLHSKIEAIIASYANPDNNYAPYNKAQLLTKAIGQPDWTSVTDANKESPAIMQEILDVMAYMIWVIKSYSYHEEIGYKGLVNKANTDLAWADALAQPLTEWLDVPSLRYSEDYLDGIYKFQPALGKALYMVDTNSYGYSVNGFKAQLRNESHIAGIVHRLDIISSISGSAIEKYNRAGNKQGDVTTFVGIGSISIDGDADDLNSVGNTYFKLYRETTNNVFPPTPPFIDTQGFELLKIFLDMDYPTYPEVEDIVLGSFTPNPTGLPPYQGVVDCTGKIFETQLDIPVDTPLQVVYQSPFIPD